MKQSNFFEPSYVVVKYPRSKLDDQDKFPDIYRELGSYSDSLKLDFIKTFPSDGEYKIVFIDPTIIMKSRQVGFTSGGPAIYINSIKFSSSEDFWKRWNRFKKLKGIL